MTVAVSGAMEAFRGVATARVERAERTASLESIVDLVWGVFSTLTQSPDVTANQV